MPELTKQWCSLVLKKLDESIVDEAHAFSEYILLAAIIHSKGLNKSAAIVKEISNDERRHREILITMKDVVAESCAPVLQCPSGQRFSIQKKRCIKV